VGQGADSRGDPKPTPDRARSRPTDYRPVGDHRSVSVHDDAVYCELCDLDRDSCPHGLADRRAESGRRVPRLLISPSNQAHFPGCPHKGDDVDYSDWGELDTAEAWQRLANGEHLPATGGARRDRIAIARCRDCVDHGPWS
jgi:hypothetical protein